MQENLSSEHPVQDIVAAYILIGVGVSNLVAHAPLIVVSFLANWPSLIIVAASLTFSFATVVPIGYVVAKISRHRKLIAQAGWSSWWPHLLAALCILGLQATVLNFLPSNTYFWWVMPITPLCIALLILPALRWVQTKRSRAPQWIIWGLVFASAAGFIVWVMLFIQAGRISG